MAYSHRRKEVDLGNLLHVSLFPDAGMYQPGASLRRTIRYQNV